VAHPLVALDALSVVRAHLIADPDVLAALGGPDRVGGRNAPPFPRVLLTDPPGGDDRGHVHLVERVVQIATLGDPADEIAKADLAQIHRTVVASVYALPTVTPSPGTPVVTWVRGSGGGFSPEPTGQRRYLSTLVLSMHP
jgi:hypothetical protein